MKFTVDNNLGAGTSLVGYVDTTLEALISVFGEPQRWDDEYEKVTAEWTIIFEDQTIATIYDWKRYEMGTPGMNELYDWHIGGENIHAVSRVSAAMGIPARVHSLGYRSSSVL